MFGNDFDVSNGSIHNFIPVICELGLSEGEQAFIINKDFDDGSLSPFFNPITATPEEVNWRVEAFVACLETQCARGLGQGTPRALMKGTTNSIDLNDTYLIFSYSI